MTWSEFKTLVRVHLHVHNRRQGIQTWIDTLIKAAVLDLQSSIPELRKGNINTIAPSSFTNTGYAAVFKIAPGAVITDIFAQSVADHTKLAFFRQIPFRRQREMVLGLLTDDDYVFTFDPASGNLTVTPLPSESNFQVVVVWDAKFADYADDTDVIFDATTAEAVAAYVMTPIAAQVDRDPAESARQMTIFRQKKRRIFSDFAESGIVVARKRRAASGLPPAATVPSSGSGDFGSDFNSDFGSGGSTPTGPSFGPDFNNDFSNS